MRASEFIAEVTDQPYRYMLVKRTDEGNQYVFMTESGTRIVVALGMETLHDGTTRLEVGFAEQTPAGLSMAPTGKGDAFRIFATVAAVVKEFLGTTKKTISQITFQGRTTEPSRIKLYDKIARNLGKFLPEFKFKGEGSHGVHKVYFFDRIMEPALA